MIIDFNKKRPANKKRSKGFTLIELLIVVSLSVMLMLSASALFMTFLLGNSKLSGTQAIKGEGEYAMAQMEFLLRNAIQLKPNLDYVTCESGMESIALQSLDGGITTLFKETDDVGGEKIASNSGVYLTSGEVSIVEGPTFDCVQSTDGLVQYVTISFRLRKGTPGVDLERDIVEQKFISGVSIRSF